MEKQFFKDILTLFRNEKGAIDLASIMVGIIVIGLVGGVVAATVFAIIPWSQDKAAKQQLDSVVSAQSAYRGLASGVPPAVPEGHAPNSYADSGKLASAGLLKSDEKTCTVTTDNGQGYKAFTRSAANKLWSVTDKVTSPQHVGEWELPSECLKLGEGDNVTNPIYIDKTPTTTMLTYQCDATTVVTLPIRDGVGIATWSDGKTSSHTGTEPISHTLQAGVQYTVTFDGTYKTMANYNASATVSGADCLRSLDHWGLETGVVTANLAYSTKLVDVPAHIPSTLTNISHMFLGASSINDSDISWWGVSNVTNTVKAFRQTGAFNQPLHNWDTSKVTDMDGMFYSAASFNQPLNTWNTSNVINMARMFSLTPMFNGSLEGWDTSSVTNMKDIFSGAAAFNQNVNSWNTAKVTDMMGVFYHAVSYNQPLNNWTTSNVTTMKSMFYGADEFDQPIGNWDTSNVTDMSDMFLSTQSFNQPLDNWKTGNVTDMSGMFLSAQIFNQPLNSWNTSKVENMTRMFALTPLFDGTISSWNTSSVTTMKEMFSGAAAFNKDVNGWNTSKVTDMYGMFYGAKALNQPLNKWDVSNVTIMKSMFYGATAYNQNLSGWNTYALVDGSVFASSSFRSDYMPAKTSK